MYRDAFPAFVGSNFRSNLFVRVSSLPAKSTAILVDKVLEHLFFFAMEAPSECL
jgi:hypothetical protein